MSIPFSEYLVGCNILLFNSYKSHIHTLLDFFDFLNCESVDHALRSTDRTVNIQFWLYQCLNFVIQSNSYFGLGRISNIFHRYLKLRCFFRWITCNLYLTCSLTPPPPGLTKRRVIRLIHIFCRKKFRGCILLSFGVFIFWI